MIEDEDDLIHHSEQNKALIFAFSPHDMVRFYDSTKHERVCLTNEFVVKKIDSVVIFYFYSFNLIAPICSICLQPNIKTSPRQDWKGSELPHDLGGIQSPFSETRVFVGTGFASR